MNALRMLPAAGRGVLAAALVLAVCELVATAPVHAEPDPVVVLESPPTAAPDGPVLQATANLGTGAVTVTNPGGTTPTEQQCGYLAQTVGTFCLGSSDQLVVPGSVPLGPPEISGVPASPYRLPGEAMDWIVDEAVSVIGVTRGIESPELVRAYARPEIRAYVVARLEQILDMKLYGQPLDEQEQGAYDELRAIYKDRLVQEAKWSLEEYDRWNANPCGYIPPSPPPGSGLQELPNGASESTLCSSAGSRFSIWAVSRGTPAADTFDAWARYRHPTSSMKHAADPRFQWAFAHSYAGALMLGGYGLAVGTSVGAGLAIMAAGNTAAVTAISNAVFPFAAVAAGTVAMTVGAIVFAFVAIAVTLGLAIWQMVEDARPGTDLRDRAARAVADDDVLGIEASAPHYVGLTSSPRQDPVDPAQKATIHQDSFRSGLVAMVNDWLLFRADGSLIPDPTTGYNPAGDTQHSDAHFVVAGQPRDTIFVAPAPEAVNLAGQPLTGYHVRISRGMLMVAERVAGSNDFGPYQPRTHVAFVDAQGNRGKMWLMRVGQVDGPPIRKFQISTIDSTGTITTTGSTSWTFRAGPAGLQTATLIEQLPVTPPTNVIPSVQGDLVADHLLQLNANLSAPGESKTGGEFSWNVERLDAAGNVVQTLPFGDLVAFQHRYTVPGDYRAKVTYEWTGPAPGSASGRVDFTIARPAPEVRGSQVLEEASIQDDRIDDDSLSLDLRLLQNTPGETFEVDVEWADDGLGNKLVEHYTVTCQDAGANTCDTGPLVPSAAGEPPSNANWSSPPTYKIPDSQNFLPHVTVTITNSYGETIRRVFAIKGEHRPKYASMTPYAAMPAGTFSTVDLVQVSPSEVFPDPSTPGIDRLQLQPFLAEMLKELPAGVSPGVVKRGEDWWLTLSGQPTADDIGVHTFYFPFEQNTVDGNARRPAPALATLEVVASTDPGYRAIIRGAPQQLSDRVYRTGYPEWMVQAAQVLAPGEEEFTDFTGTVMCRLTAGPDVVFDEPCTNNAPFPWPTEKVGGMQRASAYVDPADPDASADAPYEVTLIGQFLDPTVTVMPIAPGDTNVSVKLLVRDAASFTGVVQPPFGAAGYTVACSLDGGPLTPCLDSGTSSVPKTPGPHRLDVKVQAPDGATAVRQVTWDGGPAPDAPTPSVKQLSAVVTALPVKPGALKAGFELAVSYGAAVAAPYAGQGLVVTCAIDHHQPVPCFADGSLSLLRVPGDHHLAVRVTGHGQTVLQHRPWTVGTPPTTLTVRAPGRAEPREMVKIRATGLLPREHYVVKVAGQRLAKGKAGDYGKIARSIRIPGHLDAGPVKVHVRGATAQRSGKDRLKVVAPSGLRDLGRRLGPILV